jgi:hypothetical protein
MTDLTDEQKTESQNNLADSLAEDLINQTTPSPTIEVETGQEKKPRKKRKKKIVEPIFDLEDASSMVAIPFAMWGKPLTPEENIRLSGVVSRWLDKRAESLGKYSIDIALAVCLLEVILKRTDILTKLLTSPLPITPTVKKEEKPNAE